MFKNIHRRLAVFSTIVAGIILTGVMVLVLIVRINENQKNEVERIKNSWITILSTLQSGNQFDDNWLAQMEAGNHLVIQIEENGNPLLFPGAWSPQTNREILLNRTKKAAQQEGLNLYFAPVSSYGNQTQSIEIKGDFKDRYYALVAALPVGTGIRNIYLISYIQQNFAGSWLYPFIIFYVCGILGLWGTSWFFIGKALQPAKDAEEKQKRFIAAASHELRSPLAVINSTLFLLADDSPKQKQLIHYIDTECKRMSRLIGDMLLLYTADSKTWSLRLETVEMDSVVIDSYGSFLSLCRQKGIHLKLDLPESVVPLIEGDRQRLEQVLAILIDNAVSYSPSNTDITIKLYTEISNKPYNSEYIILEVNDQGRGIPDEIKPHIFDRFYCADYSHSNKEHFGLGLSIAKEIIEMHKGKIKVEDNIPSGTCFKIELPILNEYP